MWAAAIACCRNFSSRVRARPVRSARLLLSRSSQRRKERWGNSTISIACTVSTALVCSLCPPRMVRGWPIIISLIDSVAVIAAKVEWRFAAGIVL